jgi:DNA-binding response OmpR family regulator
MSRVLLIEPDRILADIYRLALDLQGYEVVMCASAQSAITAADLMRPDLVVLEIQLIEHSGIEFLYEFRSYPEWRLIPVLVLTNVPPAEFNGSRTLLKEELGVCAYYYKPFTSLHDFIASVAEFSSAQA